MSATPTIHKGSRVIITADGAYYHGRNAVVKVVREFTSGRYLTVSVDKERCRRDEPILISLAESDVTLSGSED